MSIVTDRIVEVLIEHAFVDGFCDCGEFDSATALDPEGYHAEHVADMLVDGLRKSGLHVVGTGAIAPAPRPFAT